MNAALQLLMAALGSLGFGILLRMEPRRLPWATLGGALTWSVYLLAEAAGWSLFPANLLAAVVANVWAAGMARFCKAPAVIFTITAVVPLIPGGSLYYTMLALVHGEEAVFVTRGTQTLLIAAALGFGTLLVTAGQLLLHSAAHKEG